jgi:REP element-mobilizing transposase RayT
MLAVCGALFDRTNMEHSGWRSRGYVPHCDAAGLVQHIVFSTARGDALLENAQAAELVERSLFFFEGARYRLVAWCVMPTHVHVIIEQMGGWPLARIAHSWKSFTANGINRLLGRDGPVWLREYFDRFMRNNDHLETTIDYVESNPVLAGLVMRPEDWTWSSARRRANVAPATVKRQIARNSRWKNGL